MSILSKDNQYKILTAGAALLAGVVVKAALTATWRKATKSEPPQNPDSPDVAWREAIVWTVASSVAVGIAGLVARRATAALLPDGHHEEPLI